ncbi:MAG: hypothetical protein ABIK37_06955 [candidate division WOR-3 bacterium]
MKDQSRNIILTGQNSLRADATNSLVARPGRCLCVSAEDFETCQRLLSAFERLAEAQRPLPRPRRTGRVIRVRADDRPT